MKRKQWVLLLILIVAMLLLSGCGVPREGVDIATQAPEGPWQTFVVWPLAKSLTWIAATFQRVGIPYYWGFAIIAFTLIIKIATFPLTISQIRGMQAQKDLQPKIQELQKKYGKDREKLSKAQMELYQEAGVNPLSGCLPMVIQMPILFGLYSALVALGQSLANANFFWIPDLGIPRYTEGMSWLKTFFAAGTAVPAGYEYLDKSGYYLLVAYLILPVLLVASQFVMQKWMTPTTGAGDQAGMTKQIGLMMTFMFGFFTLQVPAGLTLYWVTSNFLQMGQQWVVTSDRFSFAKSGPVTGKADPKGSISGNANGHAPAELPSSSADTSNNGKNPSEDKNGSGTTKQTSRRRKSKKRR